MSTRSKRSSHVEARTSSRKVAVPAPEITNRARVAPPQAQKPEKEKIEKEKEKVEKEKEKEKIEKEKEKEKGDKEKEKEATLKELVKEEQDEAESQKIDKSESDKKAKSNGVTPTTSARPAPAKRKRESDAPENGEQLDEVASSSTSNKRPAKKLRTSRRSSTREEAKGKGRLTSRVERANSSDSFMEAEKGGAFPFPSEDVDYREIEKQKLEELHDRRRKLDDYRKRTEWLLEMIQEEHSEIVKRIDELKAAKLSQYNRNGGEMKESSEADRNSTFGSDGNEEEGSGGGSDKKEDSISEEEVEGNEE